VITEEIYIVYKGKKNFLERKEFENFEDAYVYFKKDKGKYTQGRIEHHYHFCETFFDFDKKEDSIDNT
jgi:hypothetical protein